MRGGSRVVDPHRCSGRRGRGRLPLGPVRIPGWREILMH
jgi:hypothetical protein